MFDLFQPTHVLFVLLVALAVFGPKGLIEVSRSLGRGYQRLQEFKEEIRGELITTPTQDEPERKPLSSEEKG
jgi:Sec-independent protein translocase protein TatA